MSIGNKTFIILAIIVLEILVLINTSKLDMLSYKIDSLSTKLFNELDSLPRSR